MTRVTGLSTPNATDIHAQAVAATEARRANISESRCRTVSERHTVGLSGNALDGFAVPFTATCARSDLHNGGTSTVRASDDTSGVSEAAKHDHLCLVLGFSAMLARAGHKHAAFVNVIVRGVCRDLE